MLSSFNARIIPRCINRRCCFICTFIRQWGGKQTTYGTCLVISSTGTISSVVLSFVVTRRIDVCRHCCLSVGFTTDIKLSWTLFVWTADPAVSRRRAVGEMDTFWRHFNCDARVMNLHCWILVTCLSNEVTVTCHFLVTSKCNDLQSQKFNQVT